jgi:asparagine synthase (glutamine-hydrolysing)
MCGIAGIYSSRAGAPPPDRDELGRILAGLASRGPDGEGIWSSTDNRILLGHRRLAIIDLSLAGSQPMTDRSRRFTVVFNGEIYNYRELRDSLLADGAELESTSDTEVILELWRRKGVEALAELSGMYALAIWDAERRELVLARDPYGIKPLYYSVVDGVVRFASQVRALEAGGALSREVDPAAVAGFLSWGSVPEPLTLRRAIRALPAGHWCRFQTSGESRCELVPRISVGRECERTSEVFGGGAAAAALQASVTRHLVADVPIGLFLSAGLDSALIAALAVRAAAAPPTAMTLTWREAAGTLADEAPLARATARALGLRHIVQEIRAEEIRADLPRILAAMDQPSIDGFNTWLIARLARDNGLKVALSGLGGDEIFGGYSSFRDVPRWHRRTRRLAGLPGLAAVWPHAARRLAPHQPKLAGVLRYAGSLAGAYVLRRALFLPDEVDDMMAAAGLAEKPAGRRSYYAPLDAWERLGEATLGEPSHLLGDPWRAVHCLESSIYLRHQLLRDADWAGMAHGLEIRTPLVDARLRALLERANFEPAKSRGKAALVRSIAPELPAALFTRPKTGFQLPIADWLENDPTRRRASRVGAQSRRLALLVLEAFGVSLPSAA